MLDKLRQNFVRNFRCRLAFNAVALCALVRLSVAPQEAQCSEAFP